VKRSVVKTVAEFPHGENKKYSQYHYIHDPDIDERVPAHEMQTQDKDNNYGAANCAIHQSYAYQVIFDCRIFHRKSSVEFLIIS
jgi:hypothetical protein